MWQTTDGGQRARTLVGLMIVGLTLACGAAAFAQDGGALQATVRTGEGSTQQIVVAVGKSKLVDLSEPINRASVAAPEVADVQVLSPKQLLVSGKTFGTTQLIVWGQDGQNINFDIVVQLDAVEIRAALTQVEPRANLNVTVHANNLVLSGSVRDADSAARLAEVAGLYSPNVLNHLRVIGEQQVLLRVTVAEVSKNAVRQLGVNGFLAGDDFSDAFFFSNITPNGTATAISPNLTGPSPINATATIPFFVPQGGIPISSDTTFSIGFPRVQMQIFMNALRQDNLLRVLAEPNLVALSGKPANFLVGGEVPVPVPQGIQQVTIEFKRFGILLDFLPTVLSDQMIRLYVRPEVSELDPTTGQLIQGQFVFGFRQRSAETTIEIGNGQTLAIGGLLSDTLRGRTDKLPGVGDIPVLGALFRSVSYERNQTELIILVTPEIVSGMNPDQVMPAPGEDMTPPNDWQLYGLAELEGEPAPHPPNPVAALETEVPVKRQVVPDQREHMGLHGPWGMEEAPQDAPPDTE